MPTTQRGDAHLYYESHGEASAACTLVLLHGVGGNHASWFHQVAAWRERFRVVVVDARGFGNSTDPHKAGRDEFVADLEHVLDAAGVARAVMIGQSMGGGTALSLACLRPQRVQALVLADTLFGLALPEPWRSEMEAVTRRTAGLSQQERVLGPEIRRAHPSQALLYGALASFNDANVRTLTGTQALHTPDELAATGVPVLYLVGEHDALFPAAIVRAAHGLTRGSGFVQVDGVGHSAYFEAPEAFNETIERWILGLAR